MPQNTHRNENITHPSLRNGRHLIVNADLCCVPRREGRWVSGRESPAPTGREGLKEIVRREDGGRTGGRGIEKRTDKKNGKKRTGDGTLLKKEGDRCSCWFVQGSVCISGYKTDRGPSGAGSWDRTFVWRTNLRTHNNTTMAVRYKTHSSNPCALYTVLHYLASTYTISVSYLVFFYLKPVCIVNYTHTLSVRPWFSLAQEC